MRTAKTVTKTGWASVRTEDAFLGRIIQNCQPRVREYERDNRGEISPEWWSDAWIGLLVPAAIIEIETHGSDKLQGQIGYSVRVQFEVPAAYANTAFV